MLSVAVIPARAGSRGLPGKHLRSLGGIPVIVHTVRAALAATRIDRVIVSTNDEAIAAVARRAGAEVPFLRPDELAGDATPTFPVIRHAIEWLEGHGATIGLVVTLQATSPLRDAAEIDATIALLDDPAVRSAVTVTRVGLPATVVGALRDGRFHALERASSGDARRQAAPPAVRLTGAVYATRRELLDAGRLFDDAPAALLVEGPSAIDIDDAADLAAARRAIRGGSVKRDGTVRAASGATR
ncbi:MAG TPA: acylneuraminate cytidylyltransferase family protein [Candidatus Limnocylindrales bacterium]